MLHRAVWARNRGRRCGTHHAVRTHRAWLAVRSSPPSGGDSSPSSRTLRGAAWWAFSAYSRALAVYPYRTKSATSFVIMTSADYCCQVRAEEGGREGGSEGGREGGSEGARERGRERVTQSHTRTCTSTHRIYGDTCRFAQRLLRFFPRVKTLANAHTHANKRTFAYAHTFGCSRHKQASKL